MKKSRSFFVLAGLLVVMSVVPAIAQSTMTGGSTNVQLTFTSPNAFYIQNTKLPAGAYTISQGGIGQSNMLLVRSVKPGHEMFVEVTQITSPEHPPSHTQVVFNKYGDNDFLGEIWIKDKGANTAAGWQVMPSANEKAQSGSPTKHAAAAK